MEFRRVLFRSAAVEVALVEVDQAAGAQLEGRAAAGRPNGGLRRLESGAANDEAGLDAREVERGIADRPEAIVVPRGPEAVPQGKRLLGRRPQLVAQIAGEAGARDRKAWRQLGDVERHAARCLPEARGPEQGEAGARTGAG